MAITKVKVKLIGEDGNAFLILAKVTKALRQAGYDENFLLGFKDDAMGGDYDTLLQTVQTYVEVE